MKKIVSARPITPSDLWIPFDDGASGKVVLSPLREKGASKAFGFKAFNHLAFVASVRVDSEACAIALGKDIDLSADSFYLKAHNQHPETTSHPNA